MEQNLLKLIIFSKSILWLLECLGYEFILIYVSVIFCFKYFNFTYFLYISFFLLISKHNNLNKDENFSYNIFMCKIMFWATRYGMFLNVKCAKLV